MSKVVGTNSNTWNSEKFSRFKASFDQLISSHHKALQDIYLGGGEVKIQKQHGKGRLTARERISHLLDKDTSYFEIGTYGAYDMYKEYGGAPGAGVVVVVGAVSGQRCVVVANDATVKAGAFFEITLKKTIRAQEVALENNIPIIYMVDSAGVFLPLQEQVFPDEAHFGKIFYNNAQLSSQGITQIAAVMGPCVAGGAYLPVMCDKYIIVEGASMFLAGPALVKAAIGQDVTEEELGGAHTHTAISGTADYIVPNDIEGISKIQEIVSGINFPNGLVFLKDDNFSEPQYPIQEILGLFDPESYAPYDMLELVSRIVDSSEFNEYKRDYGQTLVCGNASIGGYNIGIVANQRLIVKDSDGQMQMGGVIYSDSADKAARFVMNCNQDRIPILFIHDVNGFIVGKDAEWGGIAKDGAKLVNAVSNSVVPKISMIVGGSYGAGNYAMSGRSYKSRFVFAWPSAVVSVMGGDQAANTLSQIKLARMGNVDQETRKKVYDEIKEAYDIKSDIKYGAARLWVDEVIDPLDTRKVLIQSLDAISNQRRMDSFNVGVLQV